MSRMRRAWSTLCVESEGRAKVVAEGREGSEVGLCVSSTFVPLESRDRADEEGGGIRPEVERKVGKTLMREVGWFEADGG